MKNDKITVLVKRVGQQPTIETIDNTLKAKQEIVQGYIELSYNSDLPEGVALICNEEGKFSDLLPNIYWGDTDVVFGNVFFTAHDGKGDSISLTSEQIEKVIQFVVENDATHYIGDPEDLAYANLRIATFGNDEEFYKVIAGNVLEENEGVKPLPSKTKKGMEME